MIFEGVNLVGKTGLFDVAIADGRIAAVSPSQGQKSQPSRWLSVGLVDLHVHLAWTDFHHDDQQARLPEEVEYLQGQAVQATLSTGFTTARDAGGMAPALAQRLTHDSGRLLHLWASGEALAAPDGQSAHHVRNRVRALIAEGVRWVKIFATGGLGAPPDEVLNPTMPREYFLEAVREAHRGGAKVFVHTWGGETLDWCLEAGVDSIEHGIFLTDDQASRMAQGGVALVPTAAIYRLLAQEGGPHDPGPEFRDRASRATDFHFQALRRALREGVHLGVGSDFGTPDLHGQNLLELDALADYGVPRDQVWRAATSQGYQILGDSDRGQIAVGQKADLVVFSTDPLEGSRFADLRKAIDAVVVDGHRLEISRERSGVS